MCTLLLQITGHSAELHNIGHHEVTWTMVGRQSYMDALSLVLLLASKCSPEVWLVVRSC